MPCCGRSRAQAAVAHGSVTRDAPRDRSRAGPDPRLHYTGASSILVRGPITGRSYAFTAGSPEGTVSRADVDGLLRTGLFVYATS